MTIKNSIIVARIICGIGIGFGIGTAAYMSTLPFFLLTIIFVYTEYKLLKFENKSTNDRIENKIKELQQRHAELERKDFDLRFRREMLRQRELLYKEKVKSLREVYLKGIQSEEQLLELFKRHFPNEDINNNAE
jgi:hypothetical protein